MQRLFGWLSRRRWFFSIPFVLVAGVVAYLLVAALLDWANSTGFCGTTCHVMKPEYTAYQQSPHARVRCANCHVGPGLGAEITAKWEGVRELYLYITNTFGRPIPSPVESLRPARETCEQCHWPEVFYEDRSKAIPHYSEDEANTRTDTYMLLKIGGGTQRSGQGRGIHWHIENVVEYVATDPQRQNIPWVRAQIDGETVTFVDATQKIGDADLQKYGVRRMDCIDCHNRATHIFRSGQQAVEEAVANGRLPGDLPYFRKEAVARMAATYPSQADALKALADIAGYYQQNYPQVYEQRRADIDKAVQVLQDLYSSSHFPEYKVYPNTYPDNLGHSDSPGCFRCHDGKHIAADGRSIRLHCNICHTIPQTVAAGQPAPAIPFLPAQQPQSHLASNWMAEHRNVVDQTCTSCHQMQTFCANPNCHGRSWPYVNLGAVSLPFPLPQPGPATPTPTSIPTPAVPADAVQRGRDLFAANCTVCHSQVGQVVEDEGLQRGRLVAAMRGGAEGMPVFDMSDAQVGDLVAFLAWWLQNPEEPAPTAAPAGTPTATTAPPATPAAGVPSFSTQILPVLQGKCGATCHSAAAATAGFRAVDYAGVRAVVTSGDPGASRLVQVQQAAHPARLTSAELELVIAWIKAGAPNN